MAAMRVVAGALKGRRIVAPRGRATRPTSGQVREAVFNALNSLGVVEGADVLDLFAGSGALGIEALSRGAAHCTFVEQAPPALEALRTNVRELGLDARAAVVPIEVGRYLDRERPRADLVLADPPYAFDDWSGLLARVGGGFVVAEAPTTVDPPDGWESVRTKRYGRTVVTFLEAQASTG